MKKIFSEYVFEIAGDKKYEELCKKKVENCKFDIKKVSFDIDENFQKKLGREAGHYVCLNFNELLIYDMFAKGYLTEVLKKEIKNLLKINGIEPQSILVVGLGNPKFACDSLGKSVVDRILVTTPYLDKKMYSQKDMARIYALSPGVYGTTGIDSSSLVKKVCELIKPNVVLVIDSLVASKKENLAKSIQISDTCLSPGGGVGNIRQDISTKNVGAKVFAVGVPLVVNMKDEKNQNFIVTPKDVEKQVLVTSKIIATAINQCFVNLSKQEYLQLVS